MPKAAAWSGGVVLLAAGGIGAATFTYVPKVEPGIAVGDCMIGGLTKPEAEKKLSEWFDKTAAKEFSLKSDKLETNPQAAPGSDFGAKLSLTETLSKVPFDNFFGSISRSVSRATPSKKIIDPIINFDDAKIKSLSEFVDDNAIRNRQAKVTMEGGKIVAIPEAAGVKLDEAKVKTALYRGMLTGGEVEIPLTEAPKRIKDEDLNKITGVVSTFATNFSAGNRPRSSNIKRAAEIIDGYVLMPGEKLSFNTTIGRRTVAGGFKVAGVLSSGRHEYDVGGGICQVSTTLYNASLLADLKIVKRSNHSLPVSYVPAGRDATVSYPDPDLVIENSYDFPIALDSTYTPGRLEFKILGVPQDDLQVQVITGGLRSWGNGVKYVEDSSLGYGKERVIESGSSGRSVSAWRVVKRGGVEVRRDSLGTSTYSGAQRVVARNSKAKPPEAPKPDATKPTDTTPKTDVPKEPTIPPITPGVGGELRVTRPQGKTKVNITADSLKKPVAKLATKTATVKPKTTVKKKEKTVHVVLKPTSPKTSVKPNPKPVAKKPVTKKPVTKKPVSTKKPAPKKTA